VASLAKFDLAGNRLWTRQVEPFYSGLYPYFSVSADSLGNVFFSGTTDGDIGGPNAGVTDAFVGKFNSNGDLLWTRQFGTDRHNASRDVQSDGLGNVYVPSETQVSVPWASWGQMDAGLSKYDTNGALLWSKQYGSAVDSEDNVSVTLDGQGNVYIGGNVASRQQTGDTYYGTFLTKYDALGNEIWDTRIVDPRYGAFSKAIAADSVGNVYQTGNAAPADIFLNKFNAEGELSWTRNTRELGTYAYDVAVDEFGNAFVAGSTQADLGSPNLGGAGGDAFIAKYSPAGDLDYIWQFGTERSDRALGVAIDLLGNVFVSGRTGGAFGGPNGGDYDAFVLKRSSEEVPISPGDYDDDADVDGADFLIWQRSVGSSTNLAADGDGNGSVGSEDYAIWRAHFGQVGAGGTTVPEPSTFALLGLVVAPFFGALGLKRKDGRIVASRLRALFLLSVLAAILFNSRIAQAAPAYFTGIGDLPGGTFDGQARGISEDGSVVVGIGNTDVVKLRGYDAPWQAFQWTREGGIKGIEGFHSYHPSRDIKMSADGSTVTGTVVPFGTDQDATVRWRADEGVTRLRLGAALGLSRDGASVLGWQWIDDGHTEGVIWTKSGGYGPTSYYPQFSSADLSVILGYRRESAGNPLLITADGDVPVFDFDVGSRAPLLYSLSGDGKIITGSDGNPFWWSESTGVQYFPPLPDGARVVDARGPSNEGATILGSSSKVVDSVTITRAIIWDAVHGSRYISDVLVNEFGLGNALLGWQLTSASYSSADGRTIVGRGINPAGNRETWVAHFGAPVPEPSSLLFAGMAFVSLRRWANVVD
jgi:hypothetical protein